MAYGELPNFSVHAKKTPWCESTFYEMLGVQYDPDPEGCFVRSALDEAAARKLVDIPAVSANMELYTRPAPRSWSDDPFVTKKFHELAQAYAAVSWFISIIFAWAHGAGQGGRDG